MPRVHVVAVKSINAVAEKKSKNLCFILFQLYKNNPDETYRQGCLFFFVACLKFFNLSDFINTCLMAAALKLGVNEKVGKFNCCTYANNSSAKTENV